MSDTDLGRFSVLDAEECRDLLRTHIVGRVAFTASEGLIILPVSYVSDGDRVFFRTSADGVLAQVRDGRPLAFEVDEADDSTRTGWSIMARGSAAEATGDDLPTAESPLPWAPDTRDLLIAVTLDSISGRVVSARD